MDSDHAVPDGARRQRQQLRAGDVEAFAALYRAHVDQVYRVAYRLSGDRTLAEDVTGETFLAAWKNRELVADTDEPLTPWLLAIAVRQSLNVIRGRRRHRAFLARLGHRPDSSTPDIADGVSARLDDAAILERTRSALAHLNAKEVEVLVLCVWSDVGTREAAIVLGVAQGTVRSRLSRARARLRALIEDGSAAPPQPERLRRPATRLPQPR